MFFFFNDTATTEIYTYGHTLSLHDALPICRPGTGQPHGPGAPARWRRGPAHDPWRLRRPAGAHPHAGFAKQLVGAWAMMWSAARALLLRDLRQIGRAHV